ncbi:MAG: hypothetical protein V4572_07675 [Bacteroidota bacterium]
MKLLINLSIFLLSYISWSHTNVIVTKQFGNIELRSSTAYHTEEINRNLIIGNYAELLSQKMNYSGKIFLYLQESSENEIQIWNTTEREKVHKTDYDLTVYIRVNKIEIAKCLTLLELTLTNLKNIKKYDKSFLSWYSNQVSPIALEVQQTKIFRPDDTEKLAKIEFFTYYYQSGKYHLIAKNNCETKELMTFDSFKQLAEIKPYVLCVFTTSEDVSIIDASCVYDHDKKLYYTKESKIQLNIPAFDNYLSFMPYYIRRLGKDNVIFETFWGDRVSLYSFSKGIFIENIEDKIKQ